MINPVETTSKVLELVSTKTGFLSTDILGFSRQPQLMQARHVVVAVLYELGFSYTECAKYLNRQGHHSAFNSVMVVKGNKELSNDVRNIVDEIRGR